jgi:hypothetical protein
MNPRTLACSAALLLALAGVLATSHDMRVVAQEAGPAPSIGHLTEEQFARLLDRLDGTWQPQPDKAVLFVSPIPPGGGGGSGHIYTKDASRRGIGYKDKTGDSFQVLDGKPYVGPGAVNGDYTVARWPIDEFTTENINFRNGKPLTHLMQFIAADGSWKIIVQRPVDDRGQWTTQTVSYWRKVPNGTKVW